MLLDGLEVAEVLIKNSAAKVLGLCIIHYGNRYYRITNTRDSTSISSSDVEFPFTTTAAALPTIHATQMYAGIAVGGLVCIMILILGAHCWRVTKEGSIDQMFEDNTNV